MQRSNRELWLSFLAIFLITLIYIAVALRNGSIPAAKEFFGHSLGIVGFLMMIMTEVGYSLRKRSRTAKWGRISKWLEFHIFTGIVGPYLVLLHSSWKFNGLAGIVMLLTVIIVLSGFIGRYIYTAIPRSIDGREVESSQLEMEIIKTESQLQSWLESQAGVSNFLSKQINESTQARESGWKLIFWRAFIELNHSLRWQAYISRLEPAARPQARQLENMLQRRRTLQRQAASLSLTRKMMGLWHAIHIPIGAALFTSAIFHIGGAIYYATLLH
ncbi:MAG: hypothetical protein OEZ02_03015 [Anaerolineae bacterium]|nr:hypothetical protein [Anaerolineae bacterium]